MCGVSPQQHRECGSASLEASAISSALITFTRTHVLDLCPQVADGGLSIKVEEVLDNRRLRGT